MFSAYEVLMYSSSFLVALGGVTIYGIYLIYSQNKD
jgi:hypothetical protein